MAKERRKKRRRTPKAFVDDLGTEVESSRQSDSGGARLRVLRKRSSSESMAATRTDVG